MRIIKCCTMEQHDWSAICFFRKEKYLQNSVSTSTLATTEMNDVLIFQVFFFFYLKTISDEHYLILNIFIVYTLYSPYFIWHNLTNANCLIVKNSFILYYIYIYTNILYIRKIHFAVLKLIRNCCFLI